MSQSELEKLRELIRRHKQGAVSIDKFVKERALKSLPDPYSSDIYDWTDDMLEKAGLKTSGDQPKGAKKIGAQLEADLYASLKQKIDFYLKSIGSKKTQAEIYLDIEKLIADWAKSMSGSLNAAFNDLVKRGITAGVVDSGVKMAWGHADTAALKFIASDPNRIGSRIVLFSQKLVAKMRPIIANSYTSEGVFNAKTMIEEMQKVVPAERYQLERIVRTETSAVSNIGRILGWAADPYRYYYMYHWNAYRRDHRSKPISLLRADGNPYTFTEICFLWENQSQQIAGRWQFDFYNQRALFGGTKIWTLNGMKRIRDVKKDEIILAMDEQTHKLVTTTVVANEERAMDEGYCITIKCGSITILCSPDHPFYTTQGWKKAEELTTDMELFYFPYGEKHHLNPVHQSETRCKKISDAKMVYWAIPENKERMSTEMNMRYESEAYVENLRESITRSWVNDADRKKKQSEMCSKRNFFFICKEERPDVYEKLCIKRSENQKKRMQNGELRAQMSISGKKYWSNMSETVRNVHIQKLAKNVLKVGKHPNKIESNLNSLLQKTFPDCWRYTGAGQCVIAGKIPDFVDKTNKKIIELYGDYWHRGQNPQDRIDFFAQYGYETLVIWESEFRKTPDEMLMKILLFMGEEAHNGRRIISIKKRKLRKNEKFYDLECLPHRNFVVQGGIVVHNCSLSRTPSDQERKGNRFLGQEGLFQQSTPLGIDYLQEIAPIDEESQELEKT